MLRRAIPATSPTSLLGGRHSFQAVSILTAEELKKIGLNQRRFWLCVGQRDCELCMESEFGTSKRAVFIVVLCVLYTIASLTLYLLTYVLTYILI